MADAPEVGGTVTPGEYSDAYLRYLRGVQAPESEALFGSAPRFASEAPTIAEQVARPGLIANTRALPGALLRFARPGNDYGLADFAAEHPMFVEGAPALAGQVLGHPAGVLAKSATGNPNAEGLTSDIVKGAGIGGSIGLMGGPFAPVSVPVGVGAGAAVGALWDLFRHHKGPQQEQVSLGTDDKGKPINIGVGDLTKQNQDVLNSLTAMGMSQTERDAVRDQYNSMVNSGNVALANQYLANVATRAQGQMSQNLPGLGDDTTGLSPEKMLALQQTTSQLLGPYVEQQRQAQNEMAANVAAGFASTIPNIQKLNDSLLNTTQQGNNALAASYMIQAQGQPFINAISSNYYNKGVQSYAEAGAGQGGSLADQLTGATPAIGG